MRKITGMKTSIRWSPTGSGVVGVEGVFAAGESRELVTFLRYVQGECVVDFSHASVQLHALGALLLGLDDRKPTVRFLGLREHEISTMKAFGYRLDEHNKLVRDEKG